MRFRLKPILLLLFVAFFSQSLCAQRNSKTPAKPAADPTTAPCKAPAFLRPGDKVALISPSYTVSSERTHQAADVLRAWGLVPVVGASASESYHGPFAGSDKDRLTDLRWALRDTTIKAIFCNRGGYGALHFYGALKASELAENPKWILGFSDITTLQCMEASAGVMSIHGTISSHVAYTGGTDITSTLARDLLMGTIPSYNLPSHPLNRTGHAEGILLGGNLSSFVPLLGTSMDCLKHKDIILFIEEVGETMHHIDRLFTMLRIHGVLGRCKGVVLGNFSDIDQDISYPSAEALFITYLSRYNIPVLCGFPAGHCRINLPLIIGAPVTLDVRNDGASLTFNIDGPTTVVDTKRVADSLAAQQPQKNYSAKSSKSKKGRR